MIQFIYFSHWHRSMGMGSHYLFHSLFSYYIFLLRQEHGDMSAGHELGDGSNFSMMIYFKKRFSRMIRMIKCFTLA